MLSDGTYGIIQSVKVEHLAKPETTYNFEVEDFHTYYVGEQSVLVHNANCYVDPKDINYTQDSISNKFGSGSHRGESVDDLIDALKSGQISPDDLPALKVFENDGKLYSINNRRLFAYKMAGVDSVPVQYVSQSSMTHAFTGDGISIIVRGGSKFL